MLATLSRAIVVGPIARLELQPVENKQPAGHDPLIETQIPAQQFRELVFKDGETLVVSPRTEGAWPRRAGAAALRPFVSGILGVFLIRPTWGCAILLSGALS